MLDYVWVALGGGIGSVARFWASGFIARQFGESFPWGTLAVNVTGSFLIGVFAALSAPDGRWLVPPGFRAFFMAGIFGGFTTFSAFSLQSLKLCQNGEWLYAGLNVLGSVGLCLLAVWAGYALAALVNARQ